MTTETKVKKSVSQSTSKYIDFAKSVWKRGLTILIVAPSIVFILHNRLLTGCLVWMLTMVAMLEWTAMKRHLKVALLHPKGTSYEYPVPAAKTNFFIFCKCLACSGAVVASYNGVEYYWLFTSCYFMFWVLFTLMGSNMIYAEADRKLITDDSAQSTDTPSSLSEAAQFQLQELSVITTKPNVELFLSFALEYFGFIWVLGLSHSILLYNLGAEGPFCVFTVIVSNWANDIVALLTGRGLEKTRPLYPRISPKKSLEGAVAGVLANGICASVLVIISYNPDTMHFGSDKIMLSVVFFLLGIFFGVVGVMGDLLQSLFKRTARIKDSGVFFPGHGGVLDRIDGLLLCYPLAFWLLWGFQRVYNI